MWCSQETFCQARFFFNQAFVWVSPTLHGTNKSPRFKEYNSTLSALSHSVPPFQTTCVSGLCPPKLPPYPPWFKARLWPVSFPLARGLTHRPSDVTCPTPDPPGAAQAAHRASCQCLFDATALNGYLSLFDVIKPLE